MARTKATARKTDGGKAPRKRLATRGKAKSKSPDLSDVDLKLLHPFYIGWTEEEILQCLKLIKKKFKLDLDDIIVGIVDYREKILPVITKEDDCVICMDSLLERKHITLRCLHTFHEDCLSKVRDFECPMCKKNFELYIPERIRKAIVENISAKLKSKAKREEDESIALAISMDAEERLRAAGRGHPPAPRGGGGVGRGGGAGRGWAGAGDGGWGGDGSGGGGWGGGRAARDPRDDASGGGGWGW